MTDSRTRKVAMKTMRNVFLEHFRGARLEEGFRIREVKSTVL
jgi:hypothetical protein